METINVSPPIPQPLPQKRRLSDVDLTVDSSVNPHSPHSMDSSATNGTAVSRIISRQGSPAFSTTSSLTSVSTLGTPPPMMGLDGTTDSAPRPTKRRKLTLQEKDERRKEKEEKEKAREEAKQVKDEERRIKNEAKEEKRREKELKDQQKEEEKRKKQEAIDKKERAQPRLFSFFQKPATPSTPKPLAAKVKNDPAIRTDYEKNFFAFELPSNAVLAPTSRFTWDDAAKAHLESTVDNALDPNSMDQTISLATSLSMTPFELLRGTRRPTIKEIVSRIEGCELTTRDSHAAAQEGMRQLRSTPLKCVYFSRDVRPPYIGTYTKMAEKASQIARRPFKRIRTDTDYDYDSEEDWEEPEEGEDIGSDIGSEADSNAETDDLEGFVDDDDADGQARRRFLVGDMEPVSTGLCWQTLEAQENDLPSTMREFKLSLLLDSISRPIDPFSEAYWVKDELVKPKIEDSPGSATTSRQPLQSVLSPNGITLPPKATTLKAASTTPKPPKTPGKLLDGEDLEEFKRVVEGSPVTKVALLGLLKVALPKVTNTVLKDTLESMAARLGTNAEGKKWRIVPSS